jgi:hypothetical protein
MAAAKIIGSENASLVVGFIWSSPMYASQQLQNGFVRVRDRSAGRTNR